MYRVIQIGAKTQSGGLNDGLFIPWYHVSTVMDVIAPPRADTRRQREINKKRPIISCGALGMPFLVFGRAILIVLNCAADLYFAVFCYLDSYELSLSRENAGQSSYINLVGY